MSAVRRTLDRYRRPEYTGENRCMPCTLTNVAILGVATLALAAAWVPLAVGVAVVGAVSIWLRGYLVPGTPELTRRYFPEWLLATFDKLPEANTAAVVDGEFDPETVLVAADAVEPCADVDDLCLTAEFDRTWRERMDDLRNEDALRAALATELDLDSETITVESYGDAYVARDDGARIGQWESRAALVADLAAARELPDRVDGWETLGARRRSQLLGGLRIFVERCPTCDGAVGVDTEVVESCCRSRTVVAVGCDNCGDRLLEAPYDESMIA